MPKEYALLLCGGQINHSNLPIGTNASNAMVPVNGKPVIGWILDQLLAQGIEDVVIVLQEGNNRLRDFVSWAYRERLRCAFAFVGKGGTILHSFSAGLMHVPQASSLHLILGDTLVRDLDIFAQQDFVYVGGYDVSQNWCLVQGDEHGNVTAYYDKMVDVPEGLRALVGYYHFSDVHLVKHATQMAIESQERELSHVLIRYGSQKAISIREVQDWLDFGHINPFLEAKRKLLQARFFNSLQIESTRGVITKESEKNDKLLDELNWYQALPKSLQVFAPRILEESSTEEGKVRIVQEYYGYPNLAELYVFGDLDEEIWHQTLNSLLDVAEQFRQEKGAVAQEDALQMYWHKTLDRLATIQEDPAWQALLEPETLVINDAELKNFGAMHREVHQAVKDICASLEGSVIHGDYCFSNILFDTTSQIVRVIDPRGSFGSKGIYGDPRYDLAKLRHSIVGRYDFLIAGLFTLEQRGDREYHYEIFAHGLSDSLAHYFDEALKARGIRLAEIRLIEALLFISMVPYHAGNSDRQRLMYLQGVKLLNESLPLSS